MNFNIFRIREFYRKKGRKEGREGGIYYRLDDIDGLIEALRKQPPASQIMELNSEAPGGPGYERQLIKGYLESLRRLIEELNKFSPSEELRDVIKRLEELKKIYEESINLHPYICPDLSETYGKVIVDYAAERNANRILVLVVDPSLLSPKEETRLIFESIREQAEKKGIEVSATDLGTLLSKPDYQEIRQYLLGESNELPQDILIWRDFTLKEVDEFLKENPAINHSDFIERLKIKRRLKRIPTINPYEIAKTGKRNWPKILGIQHGDLVPIIIPNTEILMTGQIPDESNVKELQVEENGIIRIITKDGNEFVITLHYNNEILNLNDFVLKIEGTFGGQGVLVNPEDMAKFILWGAKEANVNYVLEEKVELPITLQPILITPGKITQPGYYFKLSKMGLVGRFNVDLRILFNVREHNEKTDVSIVSIFCRFNYPDRPSNVSSGGGILPLIVLPQTQIEEFYKKTFELFEILHKININIENREISALERLYEILAEELEEAGFTVYGKNILFGVIPYAVSEEKIEETIKKLRVLAEKIQNYNSRNIPFYVGFDLALSPF